MNDRVRELKRQASMWCDQNIPGEFDENTCGYGYHWEEKFAELIVRECAAVCMKEIDTGWVMAPKSPWMAKQILEHFGVEE